MKTTIELPESLLFRAKTVALQRRTTLRHLVIEGLESVTRSQEAGKPGPLVSGEEAYMEIDPYGVPVLRRTEKKGSEVTNERIDALREELGI